MSVAPGRSMTFAPVVLTLAAGPAASIRLPLTRTAHPSCIVSPSNTRAGLSTVCPKAEAARKAAITNRMAVVYAPVRIFSNRWFRSFR